jgi:hypothetical protein
MGVWTKFLAGIVLVGSVLGLLAAAMSLFFLMQGALDQDASFGTVFIQIGVTFFSVCGLALAVAVLAAPAKRLA